MPIRPENRKRYPADWPAKERLCSEQMVCLEQETFRSVRVPVHGPMTAPTEKRVKRSVVPCGPCRACCRRDAIVLHPELGDKIEDYECEEVLHPFTGQTVMMLKRKPNGDCIYLEEEGCIIHENSPAICQEFDCRLLAKNASRLAKNTKDLAGSAVLKAGKMRLKAQKGRR